MGLIISLAVFAIAVWLIFYIVGMLPLPAVPKQIITVVLALILLLQLLGMLGVGGVPYYAFPR